MASSTSSTSIGDSASARFGCSRGGVFTVVALRGERYDPIAISDVFPELDLARLTHFANQPDQHDAIVAFRDELRATS